MDSLVGYGSDDEHESDRYGAHHSSGAGRRREDDTNYEEVNMDMSEDSQGQESEPELPQVERPRDRTGSADSRDRSRGGSRDRRGRRDSPSRRDRERDRREQRRDDRSRSDRPERNRGHEAPRRGLLGDRPDDRTDKPPALMDLKFGDGPPPPRSHDARDAVSPRFVDRDRRDRDREPRERERDRDNRESRHNRRDEDRRSREPRDMRERESRDVREPRDVRDMRERDSREPRDRYEDRRPRVSGAAFPPPPSVAAGSSSGYGERRSPSGDYKPSSYKVNRKLEVMEKMGLQIKTPDGSMATAQQLRAAAHEPGAPAPSYYNPQAGANKILDQVAKRKLLWAHKNKSEAEEAAKWSGTRFAADQDGKQASKFMRLMGIKDPKKNGRRKHVVPTLHKWDKGRQMMIHKSKSEAEEAAKWSGTRFAADQDGKQASKFMRLMGIKDPNAVKLDAPEKTADPIKKQEELFQAMQAQYEVARATTHTMRGVGLGFQRGQY